LKEDNVSEKEKPCLTFSVVEKMEKKNSCGLIYGFSFLLSKYLAIEIVEIEIPGFLIKVHK
jgi:hypothetical protein